MRCRGHVKGFQSYAPFSRFSYTCILISCDKEGIGGIPIRIKDSFSCTRQNVTRDQSVTEIPWCAVFWAQFHNNLIQNISDKIIHISDKFIRNVKSRIYSLPMHVHKHQLYFLEQHSKSFIIWSVIISINTDNECKSLKLKLGREHLKHTANLY